MTEPTRNRDSTAPAAQRESSAMTPPKSNKCNPDEKASSAGLDGSAIRDFLSAIVEMTDGAADIDKRSIVKPGVTLRTEARRLLQRIERHSLNDKAQPRRDEKL